MSDVVDRAANGLRWAIFKELASVADIAGTYPGDAIEQMAKSYCMAVLRAEREACAKICDGFDAINDDGFPVRSEGGVQGAETIARVIRSRT